MTKHKAALKSYADGWKRSAQLHAVWNGQDQARQDDRNARERAIVLAEWRRWHYAGLGDAPPQGAVQNGGGQWWARS